MTRVEDAGFSAHLLMCHLDRNRDGTLDPKELSRPGKQTLKEADLTTWLMSLDTDTLVKVTTYSDAWSEELAERDEDLAQSRGYRIAALALIGSSVALLLVALILALTGAGIGLAIPLFFGIVNGVAGPIAVAEWINHDRMMRACDARMDDHVATIKQVIASACTAKSAAGPISALTAPRRASEGSRLGS